MSYQKIEVFATPFVIQYFLNNPPLKSFFKKNALTVTGGNFSTDRMDMDIRRDWDAKLEVVAPRNHVPEIVAAMNAAHEELVSKAGGFVNGQDITSMDIVVSDIAALVSVRYKEGPRRDTKVLTGYNTEALGIKNGD